MRSNIHRNGKMFVLCGLSWYENSVKKKKQEQIYKLNQ